ncbi:hypothetical protein [Paracoccus spongiarum]|uniref:DUF1616 domain-containing protein n=1 Tax=Paracoccus spongiarum TaxID=3064387 RepID=A0ABT9J9L0_9RHOB|nr:hypothetical protein [Paracoccus sp. 2205BS29-5]MDP5306300.1 hypothetical protein [Paracoccus sp. 2205BS29-5]
MSETEQKNMPPNSQGSRGNFVTRHVAEGLAILISCLALLVSSIGPYQEYYLQRSALGIQLVSFGFSPTPGVAECFFDIASFNTGNRPSAILDVVLLVQSRVENEEGFSSDGVTLRSDSANLDFEGLVVDPGALSVSRVLFQRCHVPWLFQTITEGTQMDIQIHSMDSSGNRFETLIPVGIFASLSESELHVDLFLRGKTDVLGNFMYELESPPSGALYITKTGDDAYTFTVEERYSRRFN